jgi:preprotein translocase subunit SecE
MAGISAYSLGFSHHSHCLLGGWRTKVRPTKDKLQILWCYLSALCRSYVGWTLVHRVLWLFSQWLALVLIFLVLAFMVIACWVVDGLKSDLHETSFKILWCYLSVLCRSYVGWTLVHQVLWFFGQWLALVLIFWVLAFTVIACWVVDGLKSDLQKISWKFYGVICRFYVGPM